MEPPKNHLVSPMYRWGVILVGLHFLDPLGGLGGVTRE